MAFDCGKPPLASATVLLVQTSGSIVHQENTKKTCAIQQFMLKTAFHGRLKMQY